MSRIRLTLFAATLAVLALTLVSHLQGATPAFARDLNCSDFPNQAAAQAHLRANPSDPDRLDTDRDGVACESSRCPCDKAPVNRNAAAPAAAPAPAPPAAAAPAPAPAPATAPPAARPSIAPAGWAHIASLIDGDTVELDGGMRVRLFGIDAPELDTRCGPAAAEALRRLVTDNGRGYNVLLEYGPRLTDEFGSTLAYLWVADGNAWYLVDEWMALTGNARTWTRDGQYIPQVQAAEDTAHSAGAGCLWG